jgi:hypothetical protein
VAISERRTTRQEINMEWRTSTWRVWALAAGALVLAGCQTWGPTWSEVTGTQYTRTSIDRRPGILIRVGDESVGSVTPFKVAPGTYPVQVQSPKHNGFQGGIQSLTLKIEPCRRYYINAQFENPVSPTWRPVIDYVETITGCRIPG